jgi:endonuclease VIII
MPEGPSIIILKEAVQAFKGKKIMQVTANSKIGINRIEGQTIQDLKSWGKHFLICFKTCTVRIHFMLFGSYLINEKKEAAPRLSLQFKKGEINLYACSVKFIEEDPDDVYDWSCDVMNPLWDPPKSKENIKIQNGHDGMRCPA